MSLTPRLDRLDKNILINGNFDFWQRGIAFTAGNNYTADRWKTQTAGASISRQDITGLIDGARYAIRYNATSQQILLEQRVESNFSRDLEGQEVTISVKVRATSGTPSLTLESYYANAADNWASSTNEVSQGLGTLTSSFVTYSYTFTVTDNMARNGFNIILSCGSVTAIVDFAQVMLNVGDQVNEFSRAGRDYQEELQLCQRYYEKSYELEVQPGSVDDNNAVSLVSATASNSLVSSYSFCTAKRTLPSAVSYSPVTGASGNTRNDSGGADVAATLTGNTHGVRFVGSPSVAEGSVVRYHWTADAEL